MLLLIQLFLWLTRFVRSFYGYHLSLLYHIHVFWEQLVTIRYVCNKMKTNPVICQRQCLMWYENCCTCHQSLYSFKMWTNWSVCATLFHNKTDSHSDMLLWFLSSYSENSTYWFRIEKTRLSSNSDLSAPMWLFQIDVESLDIRISILNYTSFILPEMPKSNPKICIKQCGNTYLECVSSHSIFIRDVTATSNYTCSDRWHMLFEISEE